MSDGNDIFADYLQLVLQAKGDPQIQAALAAEFALSARPDVDAAQLRATLDDAAVLGWFDARLFAELLHIPQQEAAKQFAALASFSFVEPYRREESETRNIHEATRLGWRRQLATADPERWRILSRRAAACFAASTA